MHCTKSQTPSVVLRKIFIDRCLNLSIKKFSHFPIASSDSVCINIVSSLCVLKNMLFSIVGFEVALESYLVFLIHLCNMSFPLQEFPSSPPLLFKIHFYFTCTSVCLHICVCTTCMQCSWKPGHWGRPGIGFIGGYEPPCRCGECRQKFVVTKLVPIDQRSCDW